MDPEQTLVQVAKAISANEDDVARELLDAYWAWRDNGGFEPPLGDKHAERMSRLLMK